MICSSCSIETCRLTDWSRHRLIRGDLRTLPLRADTLWLQVDPGREKESVSSLSFSGYPRLLPGTLLSATPWRGLSVGNPIILSLQLESLLLPWGLFPLRTVVASQELCPGSRMLERESGSSASSCHFTSGPQSAHL